MSQPNQPSDPETPRDSIASWLGWTLFFFVMGAVAVFCGVYWLCRDDVLMGAVGCGIALVAAVMTLVCNREALRIHRARKRQR